MLSVDQMPRANTIQHIIANPDGNAHNRTAMMSGRVKIMCQLGTKKGYSQVGSDMLAAGGRPVAMNTAWQIRPPPCGRDIG